MKTYPILFKFDSKGKLREWYMEQDGNKYRTVAGIQGGSKVTSEWTVCVAKNEGKANGTTPEEQATAEIKATYQNKLTREYHETVESAKGGAHFFKPMLATAWDKRVDKIRWEDKPLLLVQPKLDGIRCSLSKDGAFSRQGKPIVAIPHIIEALKPVFEKYPDMRLDGELYNHELREDFQAIISIVRKQKPTAEHLAKSKELMQYHIYDGPSFKGSSNERLLSVASCLKQVGIQLDDEACCLQIVDSIFVNAKELVDKCHNEFLSLGYEGSIIRLPGSYEQKRSNLLLKRKEFTDAEFEIIRIEEGLGNWSGAAKRVVFRNDSDGSEVGAGLKGTMEQCQQILKEAADYVGGKATIMYFGRSNEGIPRFPIAKAVFKGRRDV